MDSIPAPSPSSPVSERHFDQGQRAPVARRSDAGFNDWLASLPVDNWSGAIDESSFTDVEWIDGVGFVKSEP